MYNENQSYKDLREKIINIQKQQWIPALTPSCSSVGITFEKAIGKEIDNFEIPDYQGIEIKTKVSEKECYITLFNATPDSFLYEIKRIQEKYGYPDKLYCEYKVFQISVNSLYRHYLANGFSFQLLVNRRNKIIELVVFNQFNVIVDKNTSWSFDLLEEKLKRKLNFLLFVKAEKIYRKNKLYFKYNKIYFYKLNSFNSFIEALNRGYIRVNFKISVFKNGKRKGQIHDRGTGFDLNIENIDSVFTLLDAF